MTTQEKQTVLYFLGHKPCEFEGCVIHKDVDGMVTNVDEFNFDYNMIFEIIEKMQIMWMKTSFAYSGLFGENLHTIKRQIFLGIDFCWKNILDAINYLNDGKQ